ncbi:hypothetical protein DFH07DRAFT_783623 [Mycena maculata]|uniref:Uncharacterized protein n=1 Tax=Mycena maculata TaxID=230809 RepID=A0AAD7HL97_9AGAR|nr:hypothetical protein DFH07DRAFT_783623 [Mycena maculata]
MKFFTSLLVSAMLTTATLAQSIDIGAPASGATVPAGSNITVEVDKPDTLTGSTEVAIVIGLLSCVGLPDGCPSPADDIGDVLYNGPYNPQFQEATPGKPPYQNFSVAIPGSVPSGPAQLSVVHLSLVGLGPMPFFQIVNITVNVD